jgi:CO dehydrogenase maturation factor
VRGVIEQLGTAAGGAAGGSAARSEITVIDMEASLEHLSRGTLRHADVLLIVVEPYFRALETAGRTVRFARELRIPHLFGVANKLRGPEDERAIREYCAGQHLEVIAAVPFDEQVTAADRAGAAVLDAAPAGPAVRAIEALADALQERLGMLGAPRPADSWPQR